MKLKRWPLIIASTLGVYAIALTTIAVFISSKNVDLIQDDYYVESLNFNERQAMKSAHKSLAEPASFTINRKDKTVDFSLPREFSSEGYVLNLRLIRPDNAELDFTISENKYLENNFSIPFNLFPKNGRWNVFFQYTSSAGKSYLLEDKLSL